VRPEVVHPTRDVSPRGYKLATFRDVFERYLQGDSENLTARTQPIMTGGSMHMAMCTQRVLRADPKSYRTSIKSAVRAGVRIENRKKHLEREKQALGGLGDSLEQFDFESDGWPS